MTDLIKQVTDVHKIVINLINKIQDMDQRLLVLEEKSKPQDES